MTSKAALTTERKANGNSGEKERQKRAQHLVNQIFYMNWKIVVGILLILGGVDAWGICDRNHGKEGQIQVEKVRHLFGQDYHSLQIHCDSLRVNSLGRICQMPQ